MRSAATLPSPRARRAPRVIAVAVAALVLLPTAATGQSPGAGTPAPAAERTAEPTAASVSLLPRDASSDDPHGGTWFLFTLDPGASGRAVASLTNPAPAPARVSLELRELTFTEDGTPTLGEEGAGLAAWGAFDDEEVVVPGGTTVPVAFQLTVPSGTAPGDHIGAAVAVTRHELDGTEVVQQVATRIVVTVPGETSRSLEITRIDLEHAGGLLPGPVVARVTVRNTGSIRLAPRVTVADQDAAGTRLLTREATDTYVAEVPVRAWGGVVHLPVVVTDASGVTRRIDESMFLVPWWLVGLLAVAAAAWAVRRRLAGPSEDASLQADVRRLERLVVDVQRRLDAALAVVPDTSEGGTSRADQVKALELSLVRARRSGEWEVFAALALALHELTGAASAELAEAAAADTTYRVEIERALAGTSMPSSN